MTPATRKNIAMLSARVEDGKVRLACFKVTPFYTATGKEKPDSVKLRIRRADLPDFRFGETYDEFFDGLCWRDAAVVFEGAVSAVNNRKYEYVDDRVATGGNYAYWIGTDRGDEPTGPVAVRVRDPRIWWPWAEVERRLSALAAGLPDRVEIREVGATVHGRRLRALVAGHRERTLALVGAVHPGESGPELIVPTFERVVRHHQELLGKVGLAILPSVNADERERLALGHAPYLRKNANGVDLNRNFPAAWEVVDLMYGYATSDADGQTYRGPAPASEPETQAVMNFLEGLKPAGVLSFHHLASLTGSAFIYSAAAANDAAYVTRCREWNRAYRLAYAPDAAVGMPVVMQGVCSAGSLPSWIYARFKAPAFDLEGDGLPGCKRATVDMATYDDLVNCQERHARAVVALLTTLAGSE